MESHEVIDADTLESTVSDVIQEYSNLALGQIQLGSLVIRLLRLLGEHHVRFPTHLIWLSKAITTIEEVAHRMDPDFNMLEFAQPYVRRFLFRSLNPLDRAKEAYLTTLEALDLVRDLPYDISVIMDQLKKGRVKIEFEHIGLDPFRKTLNKATNRLAGTLVLAALIIASALIVVAGVPPKLGEIPIIGIAGFGIALFMAIGLMISVIFDR
jgi:ubiquinone biosynthesis protein